MSDKLLLRVLIVIGGIAVALQLIAPFIATTEGVDFPCLRWWNENFWLQLSSGIVFPHWIGPAYGGLGAPSLYFYPPLMFYESAAVHFLTGISDGGRLFQMTGLLATIGSFITCRIFLRRIAASNWQAALGAAIFAFAPYRVAELYNRSASAHFGYMLLPLVWYGILKLFRNDPAEQRCGMVIFAISFATLILSNIPLTAVAAVTIVVIAVVEWREIDVRVARQFILGGLLAAGLVAFYLIPILQYRPYSHLEQVWLENGKTRNPGYFIHDILTLTDAAALYYIGLTYLAMAIIAFAYYWVRRRRQVFDATEVLTLRVTLGFSAVLLFLQIPVISLPVWEHVPGFAIIQGGWRFYIDIVLLVALVAAVAKQDVLKRCVLVLSIVWAIATMPGIILVLFHTHLHGHGKGRPNFDAPEYASIYVPFKTQAELESLVDRHTEEPTYLPWGGIASQESLSTPVNHGNREVFNVQLQSARRATFHRFYWPAWHLYANGRELHIWPDSIGRAIADLPSGRYQATWQLQRSWQEWAGYATSGIAMIIVVIIAGIGRFRKRVSVHQPSFTE